MMSNQIVRLDRNFQNHDGLIKIQRHFQEESQLNKSSHIRASHDSAKDSYNQNIVQKSPHIQPTSNRFFSRNRMSYVGDLQDSIKKLEVIKNKHSQNFKETHFSLERIGLNPQGYTKIVYKKQPTNCVNLIKEYINNLSMSFETEIKSPPGQYQKQQISQGREQGYFPMNIESIQNKDCRYLTKNVNMKNLPNNSKDGIVEEYSQKLLEQLKDVFAKKRKQKDMAEKNMIQHKQIKNDNKNENKQKTFMTSEQLQDTIDHLPPRYQRENKQHLPQKSIQKTRTSTGVSSPINQQEKIFSPSKRMNQKQLPLCKIVYSQNKEKSHSPIPTTIKSPQCKSPIQLIYSSPKFKEQKSTQLNGSMLHNQNNILVDGGIFNKTTFHDDNKSNQQKYSKDDMNQTSNQSQKNKIQNVQSRKCSSPMKNINQFNIQKIFMINDVYIKGEIQKDREFKQSQQKEYQNQTLKESQKSQENLNNQSSQDNNIDFLQIQNFGRKYTKSNARNIKQFYLSKTQFDDSSYVNDTSYIKEQLSNEHTQILQNNKSQDNLLNQENIQSQQNIKDKKNNSNDEFHKSQYSQKNIKEQQLTGNSSIMLESMASYEETSEILRQITQDKQSKISKHLNKFGINNKYSKKDYLKESNYSITQEFLDINFENEELKPKLKTQQKGLNQSQINQKEDETQTLINYSEQFNNSRYELFSPQTFSNSKQEIFQTSKNNFQNQTQFDQNFHVKEQRQRMKSVQSQNNREQVILPRVASKSPDVSRNMSIMQQCQKEIKNLNQLTKKWERNMDRMQEERKKFIQPCIQKYVRVIGIS